MKKVKVLICSFCMAMVFSVSPAFAVVEVIKVLQYSLRNVQEVIEVVKNGIALVTSIKQTKLQGLVGAVGLKVEGLDQDALSKIDYKKFSPVLSADLQSIVSSGKYSAIPKVRTYIENEMKSIRLGDGVTQRDVLNKINERQNLVSLETIDKAKEALARANKGIQENATQLANVGSAKNSHQKESQETAQSVQTLRNEVARNQLTANLLQTKAVDYHAKVLKATQKGKETVNKVNEASNRIENVAGGGR